MESCDGTVFRAAQSALVSFCGVGGHSSVISGPETPLGIQRELQRPRAGVGLLADFGPQIRGMSVLLFL